MQYVHASLNRLPSNEIVAARSSRRVMSALLSAGTVVLLQHSVKRVFASHGSVATRVATSRPLVL